MAKGELNIQKKFWQKSAFKIFIAIILLAVVLTPLGMYMEGFYPPQKPEDITSMNIGDTVLPGMDVVDDGKIRKVPVLSHTEYLIDYAKDLRVIDIIDSVITGVVRTPIAQITSGSVSRYGVAQGFEGPGMLKVNAGKLVVQAPGNFIWGYKTPYTYGIKTKDGLKIVEGGKTLKTVAYDDISNDTVPHDYLSSNRTKRWYLKSDEGDKVALDYALSYFNDGRNMVSPSQIKKYFGESVQEYMENYPNGSPIMAYMHSYTEETSSSAVSFLGSYPQYDDSKRAFNARAFAASWNGTIIPPNTRSSGKETVRFTASRDPHAPGGYASHGSCPPARALRAVSSDAGFPLPSGMTWEYHAVLFGFNPATGIKVNNTGKYPVKIIMWTTGSGGGTKIYARMVRLVPN